jgi:hypothetical protein
MHKVKPMAQNTPTLGRKNIYFVEVLYKGVSVPIKVEKA